MKVKNDIAQVFALQQIRGGWNDHMALVSRGNNFSKSLPV